ncbi:MAG: sulfide/dihydroorotate dehydrogenase-like FAD/NAD-binding protein [Oscillospiraceae bacterium]|nr:sulfide/dihydroorotate dehydrogenase-like FAD/NAD-binding protein [Oscillospiraceae bacterium]
MFRIVRKKELNPSVTLMELEAPYIAAKAKPGQFVIFRVDEQGERVPLTLAGCDPEKGTVTLIFQLVGRSTQKLAAREEGESILDLVGPLGLPTTLPESVKRICVIGGGVGCAIAYPQAKAFHAQGLHVDVIAGFRSKDIVILEEEFRSHSSELILCTDDGSYGQKGFVTDALKARIESGIQYDAVIAIGPIPMMKFVCLLTKEYGIPTIVSLNPIMVDGTGMCGGCRVTVDGRVRYACVEGPDFDGHLVDFDELMRRNNTFREREAECRMMRAAEQAANRR